MFPILVAELVFSAPIRVLVAMAGPLLSSSFLTTHRSPLGAVWPGPPSFLLLILLSPSFLESLIEFLSRISSIFRLLRALARSSLSLSQ